MRLENLSLSISGGEIVQESKKLVKVNMLLNKTASKTRVLNLSFLIHRAHMAQNVLVAFTGVTAFTIRNHRVHSKLCVLTLFNKMRTHSRGNYIGHIGLSFWEVSSKIHLFPAVLLLD
jgi:hypothetical protein